MSGGASLDLARGAARVALLPHVGGAIAAFSWRDVDVLRPMPDEARATGNVRLAACYPLVPYSNRIRDARLRFGNADHALTRNFGDHPHAIHGVGWQRAWRIERATGASAVIAYDHVAQGDDARAWPWPFRAMQAFDLSGDGVRARLLAMLTIANTGDAPFPYGLGWHPYFPRDASSTLRFDADHYWRNDATQLPVEQIPAAADWSFSAGRGFGDVTIDNVFGGWAGSATLDSRERGLATTIVADRACDRLVVYAPAGHGFVAIEPVTHETDAFNRAARGAIGTGMRVLAPGAAFSCTMGIEVSALR